MTATNELAGNPGALTERGLPHPLTAADLDTFEAAWEASTGGTWLQCKGGDCPCAMVWTNDGNVAVAVHEPVTEQDVTLTSAQQMAVARWLALSHNLTPRLIAELRAARATIERARIAADAGLWGDVMDALHGKVKG